MVVVSRVSEEEESGRRIPPVFTPAFPGRSHVCRVRRDVRRGCVVTWVSSSRTIKCRIGNISAEWGVVPKFVLVKQLQARYVQQRVEGRPEIAIVARVFLQRGVEHMVCHSPAHLVIFEVAQIFRGLIRVNKNIVRMIEARIFAGRGTNE